MGKRKPESPPKDFLARYQRAGWLSRQALVVEYGEEKVKAWEKDLNLTPPPKTTIRKVVRPKVCPHDSVAWEEVQVEYVQGDVTVWQEGYCNICKAYLQRDYEAQPPKVVTPGIDDS